MSVHIVFKTINFVNSQAARTYNLLANHKLLLITLASFEGGNGIFPSIECLAEKLNVTSRYVSDLIKDLTNRGLLFIKGQAGRVNRYLLTIPELSTDEPELIQNSTAVTPEKLSTTPELEFTPPLNHSSVTPEPQFTRNNQRITKGIALKPIREKKKKSVKNNQTKKEQEIELPNWIKKSDWDDFLSHRKSVKSPMSYIAQKRAITELQKLHNQGYLPADVIQQSIVNGWKGFFPIKNYKGQNDGKQFRKPETGSERLWRVCGSHLLNSVA